MSKYEVNNLFIHHSPILEEGRVPRKLKTKWPELWGMYDPTDPVEVAVVWIGIIPIIVGIVIGVSALVVMLL